MAHSVYCGVYEKLKHAVQHLDIRCGRLTKSLLAVVGHLVNTEPVFFPGVLSTTPVGVT